LLSNSATMSAAISSGNLLLNWPVAAAGFSVQARSSLASGSWVTLTNAAILAGSNWQVSLPASSGAQFFRLWR